MGELVDLLFVYGTLKDKSAHPMARYLWRHATYLGRATFQGRLYRPAYYPAVVASADPADKVTGAVFYLRSRAILKKLDDYEGCSVRDVAPYLFRREIVTVTDARGHLRQAWIYLYNRPLSSTGEAEVTSPLPPP